MACLFVYDGYISRMMEVMKRINLLLSFFRRYTYILVLFSALLVLLYCGALRGNKTCFWTQGESITVCLYNLIQLGSLMFIIEDIDSTENTYFIF